MKIIFTFIAFFLSLAVADAQKHAALLSVRGIGGNKYDRVSPHVTPTTDSGFIICFTTTSTMGNIDSICPNTGTMAIFQKYNASGILEWTRCCQSDTDGYYTFLFPLANGDFIQGGDKDRNYSIRKLGAAGNVIWSKMYGGTWDEFLEDMIATNDGGYIMFGESYSTDGDVGLHYGDHFLPDLWAIKLDSNGNKVWSKDIGGSSEEDGNTVSPGPHGSCYVFGETQSSDYDCTGFHGSIDAYVARLDSNGNLLWHRDLGGSGQDGYLGYSWTCADKNGKLLIATGAGSSDGDVHHQVDTGALNVWVIQIDSNGNILWDNCYGSKYGCLPHAICRNVNGDIWVAAASAYKSGQVDTAFGRSDAWIVHTDSIGNLIDTKVMGTHANDEATMIWSLSDDRILVGGFYDTAAVAGEEMPTNWYGVDDIFLATFSPWPEDVPRLQAEHVDMMQVYPNPANKQINIRLQTTTNDSYRVLIYNIIGSRVYDEILKNANSVLQVNVNDWPKGMYYVVASNADGIKEIKKVIIQ